MAIPGGICSLIMMITQWNHFRNAVSRQQFVVYSVNGFSALEWMEDGQSYFMADSALIRDQERMRFHIRPNRLNSGVVVIHEQVPFKREFEKGVHMVQWKGNSIAFVEQKNFSLPELTEIDYLVIGKNSINTKNLPKRLKVKKVILDGSNSGWYVDRWKAISKQENLTVYAVLEEGAFILTE